MKPRMLEKYREEILNTQILRERFKVSQNAIDTALDAVVPIDITPAARWFYEENEQEEYDIDTDFPTVTPPWEVCWMEFMSPHYSNNQGRLVHRPAWLKSIGALITCFKLKDGRSALKEDAMLKMMEVEFEATHGKSLYEDVDAIGIQKLRERREALLDALDNGLEAKWLVNMCIYYDVRGIQLVSTVNCRYFLSPSGRPLPGTNMHIPTADLVRAVRTVRGIDPDVAGFSTDVFPFFFAASLLHCKNVQVVDLPFAAPLKVRQAREKRGISAIRYKTLVVEPMRQITRERYESDPNRDRQSTVQRALHIMRGHFKDYRDGKGLFGKFHDIYWWDMHVRGNADFGEIKKDYRVKR